MLGYRYFKARPTDHVFIYTGGRLTRQGLGRAGFVFTPFATVAAVPMDARDDVFAVESVSSDHQNVTIQGLISHRIADPVAAAGRQDFSIDLQTLKPNGEPMKQVAQRQVREQLMRQADAAVFERRRAASEDEHQLSLCNIESSVASGVIFADGIESGAIAFDAGMTATIAPSARRVRLLQ